MQVNGKGQPCYCTDAKTMHYILMTFLPNKPAARQYRMMCADIVARFQSGDTSLHDQIDRNHAQAQANGGIPQFKAVPAPPPVQPTVPDVTAQVLQQGKPEGKPDGKRPRDEEDDPASMQLSLSERSMKLDERKALFAIEIEERKAESEIKIAKRKNEAAMELKERFIRVIKEEATLLQELGVCDDRAKLQFKDAIMNHSPGKQLALEAASAPA